MIESLLIIQYLLLALVFLAPLLFVALIWAVVQPYRDHQDIIDNIRRRSWIVRVRCETK